MGLVNRLDSAVDFERVSWLLEEPIVNFSQSVVDEVIKVNAEFHAGAGLSAKVVRQSAGNCCDWCAELVGSYDYPDVPKDVYRRHRFCRCTVDYVPRKGRRQNVHSKRWIESDKSGKIKERSSILNKVQAGAKNYVRDSSEDYLRTSTEIKREEHAYRLYDTIKNSNQEIEKRKIYSNIGKFHEMRDFTKADVDIAFNHVFNDLHDLDFGQGLFPPDADMADSWWRLINGQDIYDHDLLMLRHERLEHDYMYATSQLSYDEAHELTNKTYDYSEATKKFNERKRW